MDAERAYLQELAARLRGLLGSNLLGVYAGGSYALGGYEPGKSDLDVAVVVHEPLDVRTVDRLVDALRHEALAVPARKLELVAYRLEDARAGGVVPALELNLNTGPDEFRADREPRPGEGHWFAIDRSILAANGVALAGPPAGEVFSSPPREALLPVLAQTLRWYLREEPDGEAAVLNAGRSLRFAREGVWSSKPELRPWADDQAGTNREILERAIAELEAT